MAEVPAERDREGLVRHAVAAHAMRHGAGDPQIGSPVWHAGELGENAPRLGEGFVHVP